MPNAFRKTTGQIPDGLLRVGATATSAFLDLARASPPRSVSFYFTRVPPLVGEI